MDRMTFALPRARRANRCDPGRPSQRRLHRSSPTPAGAAALATAAALAAAAAAVVASAPAAAGEAATARPWGRALTPDGIPSHTENFPSPTGTLRLVDALAAALMGSHDLAADAVEIRRREAQALQAGLLRNPVIGIQAEDFAGPSQRKRLGYQQTTLSIAQLVELGGKRAARRRLAEHERDLATWDYETRRIAVLADTTKAFVVVLALQERRALLEDLERIAAQMLRSVASTVRAGAVSPVEEDRAAVNLDRVRLEVAQLDDELSAGRALLAASWGEPQAGFDAVTGDLWALPPMPARDALLALADENPELARWHAEIEKREAALAVERAARIPNVEVSLAGRHHPLGDAFGVVAGVSLSVPIFDRNQGGVLAARHALAHARVDRRARDASIRSTIVAALERFRIAHRTVVTLRDQIIPRAERIFERTRRGYATGLFRHVEVLDAQRTLFGARRELLDSALALHFAATDLERLTGTPLAEVAANPGAESGPETDAGGDAGAAARAGADAGAGAGRDAAAGGAAEAHADARRTER